MFPVEQRYRPFEESRDYDLNNAIADGVDELWRDPHNAGRHPGLFARRARDPRGRRPPAQAPGAPAAVPRTPRCCRCSRGCQPAEQDRIFDGHSGRRIVLATNVAETSLTVPGIRYVIDAGTARVKRYSFRSKVEQLLVEPISQAAANQRAGRCGRVANGICIRLYDEKDFAGRPRFTDPEILRSSLAGVILRMKSLHLGVVERFPVPRAPAPRAIADGYQLLAELGAVDDANELTATGAELARLPLDPRVGRMILEARSRGALDEVLVIASALSVQDVRDRPMEAQAAGRPGACQVRRREERVQRLSQAVAVRRGGGSSPGAEMRPAPTRRAASTTGPQAHQPPVRAAAAAELHQHAPRARVARHPFAAADRRGRAQVAHQCRSPPATSRCTCRCWPGLLGNIGWKMEDEEVYLGARGIKFYKHPGRAPVQKKPGRWIVAAELVETTRLFGRGVANIEPQWLEQVVRPPAQEAAARSALGEEGRAGDRAGARHAVRASWSTADGASTSPRWTRWRRAKSSSAKGWWAGEWDSQAALSGGQPQAHQAQVEGPGAQGAPTGRAGGRRVDLRLLRRSSCRPTWPAEQSCERWYRDHARSPAAPAATSRATS